MKHDCHIAIIEDDDGIRDSMTDALETEGYTVKSFRNGKEALDGLPGPVVPSLILLDLMMPVMDGWQFMSVRKNMPSPYDEIPVIIVSAVAEPQKVKDAGATGYIRKPLDLDVLLKLVDGYCHPPSAQC